MGRDAKRGMLGGAAPLTSQQLEWHLENLRQGTDWSPTLGVLHQQITDPGRDSQSVELLQALIAAVGERNRAGAAGKHWKRSPLLADLAEQMPHVLAVARPRLRAWLGRHRDFGPSKLSREAIDEELLALCKDPWLDLYAKDLVDGARLERWLQLKASALYSWSEEARPTPAGDIRQFLELISDERAGELCSRAARLAAAGIVARQSGGDAQARICALYELVGLIPRTADFTVRSRGEVHLVRSGSQIQTLCDLDLDEATPRLTRAAWRRAAARGAHCKACAARRSPRGAAPEEGQSSVFSEARMQEILAGAGGELEREIRVLSERGPTGSWRKRTSTKVWMRFTSDAAAACADQLDTLDICSALDVPQPPERTLSRTELTELVRVYLRAPAHLAEKRLRIYLAMFAK